MAVNLIWFSSKVTLIALKMWWV